MIKTVRISELKPASYNPRKLSDNAQQDLKASITELGIIKPIVVRGSDNLILAGHQRTKTMKLLGIEECPAFIVDGVNKQDEVRFNQLHNMTEAEITDNMPVVICNVPDNVTGFIRIPNKDIQIVKRGEGSKVVQLTSMMLRFGEFASVVCDQKGRVLVSSIYAMAAKINGFDLLAYILPSGKEQLCLDYFSKDYGEFSYDMIKRKTYMQSFAQMMRLRPSMKDKTNFKKQKHSTLYDKVVLPNISKDMKILDFGAGHKDYATKLKSNGYDIDAIEFYHRKVGSNYIDEKEIRQDFNSIIKSLNERGGYDVVICDSVLNSVDSLKAEKSVLSTLSALCKKGGLVFWSGISLALANYNNQLKTAKVMKNNNHFLDENNFTAIMRCGEWYFQHYHNISDVKRLTADYIGNIQSIYNDGLEIPINKSEFRPATFQVKAINTRPATKDDYLEAIRFEFSLPLPNGKRWDFADKILPIMEKLL